MPGYIEDKVLPLAAMCAGIAAGVFVALIRTYEKLVEPKLPSSIRGFVNVFKDRLPLEQISGRLPVEDGKTQATNDEGGENAQKEDGQGASSEDVEQDQTPEQTGNGNAVDQTLKTDGDANEDASDGNKGENGVPAEETSEGSLPVSKSSELEEDLTPATPDGNSELNKSTSNGQQAAAKVAGKKKSGKGRRA